MRPGLPFPPWILISWLACAAAGCGGSSQAPSASAALTPTQAALFDDGIDLLADPNALQDRWRTDWQTETQQRVAESDWIGLGTITTVRTQEDPGQDTSYQLVMSVERTLVGQHPGKEQVLISRPGALGFRSVADHRDEALRLRVVAFVKYAREGGGVVAHYHLVIPSQPVFSAVDVRSRGPAHEVKIIERTQK